MNGSTHRNVKLFLRESSDKLNELFTAISFGCQGISQGILEWWNVGKSNTGVMGFAGSTHPTQRSGIPAFHSSNLPSFFL
jgi:hypothetical protein